MTQAKQLAVILALWCIISISAIIFDIAVIKQLNNVFVIIVCALASWFFTTEEE